MQHVSYEVPGWGVGEYWLADGMLVHHDAPARRTSSPNRSRDGLAGRFREWFRGSRDDFLDVELDVEELTPFSRALLEALRSVPYGEVVTYGELAALAGRPGAARAAGTFCALNRFSLVVPCHRVVASSGIGGYGTAGVPFKRRLLEVEGVTL